VSKHEIQQENTINITFDDENTSVDQIIATLNKSEVAVSGPPVLIK
jgi:hypothetical protein